MSMVTVSRKRARVYRRKFDHDEALRLRSEGHACGKIAAMLGVSEQAIRRVVVPGERERMEAQYRRTYAGTCETCGGPCLSIRHAGKRDHNPDGRELCQRCRSDEKIERIRFDSDGALTEVRCSSEDCANGERWQPPENFGRGPSHRRFREGGISNHCRACQTAKRRDYRRRNRARERAYDRAYRASRRLAAKP